MLNAGNHHTINDLFKQLGLDSSDAAIEKFVAEHKPIEAAGVAEAKIWSDSQQAFLDDALSSDGAWAMAIDDLNARLKG